MADAYRQRMLEASKLNRQTINETKRQIARLYEQAAEDMAKKAANVETRRAAIKAANAKRPDTKQAVVKSRLTETWANTYANELRGRVSELWKDVGDLAQAGMQKAASRMVDVQLGVLNDASAMAGLDMGRRFVATFAHTPDEAIAAVLQGGLYGGERAMLSKRIWNNEAMQSRQIEQTIAQGIAQKQSPTQLAKALEAYINPKAAMPDDWNNVYTDLPFNYKVDFNAKRLAVTAINHAAWSGMIMASRQSPFVDFIHWETSSIHVMHDICDAYADHEEGLGTGNYAVDNVPLPHPFCTCIWFPDSAKSLEDIAKELSSWEQGESNPALDKAFGDWQEINESEKGDKK